MIKRLDIGILRLSVMLLLAVALSVHGQDFANEQQQMTSPEPEAQKEEEDIKALNEINDVALEMDKELIQLELNQDTLWDFMPRIPAEIRNIGGPPIGVLAPDGFVLRLYSTDDIPPVAYWGTSDKVAVSANSTSAGYIGEASDDGVLRTDDTIDYANSTNYVTLSVNASNVWTNIVNNSYYGSSSGGVPDGSARGQVLWWDGTNWLATATPSAPAVLVYDTKGNASGNVRWENVPTLYKGVYRDTNDQISADWVRAH